MNNTPHPDRSVEASRVREELAHDPQALRALDALAREETADIDIPPIPDDLRDQWQDRFGAAREPAPVEKTSWLTRLYGLWMYSGATALAALAIFFVLQQDRPSPATADPTRPILRGSGDFAPREDTVTVFIASEAIPFQSFSTTRQADFTLEANDLESAISLLKEKSIDSAVILDASTGKVSPWNGALLEEIPLIEISDNTDEYDLSEALDLFLQAK